MTDAARGPWEGMTIANGRYQQLTTLGEGGMGFVYRALDKNLQTPVVIKSPRRALLEDAQHVGRFQREVGAMIQLSYPHIVPVIDVGQHDGVPFAVMRYMAGGNLQDRMKTDAAGHPLPMPLASLPTWLASIAQALDFVHKQQYLHRDVKPANILFDSHNHAYLSDFGIIKALGEMAEARSSKLTSDGFMVGTVDYMAPELLTGQAVDGRSDQYALAATVYQVLSGHVPFEGTTAGAVIVQQVSQPPRPLSSIVRGLPPTVSATVLRGLAKAPQERFATCSEFAKALLQASRGEAAATAAPVPAPAAAPVSTAGHRATAVLPTPAFAGTHRTTAVMPAPFQPAVPAPSAPKASATSHRGAWIAGGVISALAIVGLGAVLLTSSSSDNDAQYEVLESDPLPRLISKWNERANQVEDTLVVNSKALRAQPQYASADEFTKLIDAQTTKTSPDAGPQIEELDRDLKAMRTLYAQLLDRLKRRINSEWSAPSSDARQQREQLALEERGLQEQESKLKTMQRRLDELQSLQQGAASKKYDAGAIAELAALREIEAAATAKERPQIAAATRTRANELLDVSNEKLSALALNVLVRTGDAAAVRMAGNRLERSEPELQVSLCTSLLISKDADAIAAVAAFIKDHAETAKQLDLPRLLQLVDNDLKLYQPLVEPLAALCTTSDQRLLLAISQTRAMNDGWAQGIEQACKSGLLKSRVDEIVVEIVARDRKSAFPLAKRLLEQHPDIKLKDLAVDELQRTVDEDREFGTQLMEQLLLQGSGSSRAAALQAYRTGKLPFHDAALRSRVEKEGAAEPATLLNGLLVTDDARCLDLAEVVLAHPQGIEPAKVDYVRITAAALERKAIRQPLAVLSLQAPEAGRAWALQQLLRPTFVDQFRKAEATNRRQLAELKQMTGVLNGKLKVVKGQATLSNTDRGLEVSKDELAHLKTEIDSEIFGSDGKFEASLLKLREGLTGVRESVDARFADDMEQIDTYLGELLELTKIGRELGKVYDLTVAQQLPGARRELQKKKLEAWSFRFTRGNIETFQREMPRYETAEKQLVSSRSSLPAFLLKPPGPPSGKVSKREGDSP